MSIEDGSRKVGSVIGRTAGTLVNAAGTVTHIPMDVADSIGDKYSETRVAKTKRSKRALPDEINIVDLFHKKIFNFVDFDFVLKCMRDSGLAACEGIHTITSLSHELVPKLTEEALQRRDARGILELYPAIVKLCIRRRKGFLIHVDLVAGKVKKLNRIEDFVQYIGIASGVHLRDLVFPTEYAIPKLRGRVVSNKIFDSNKTDDLEVIMTPNEAIDKSTAVPKQTSAESKIEPEIGVRSASRAAYIDYDEKPFDKTIDDKSDTSLFSSQTMGYVELFCMKHKHALECEDVSSLAPNDIFNVLMFHIINRLPQTKDISVRDINAYVSGVASVYAGCGVEDIMTCIRGSSRGFASCLRTLYEVPEGSGDSNDVWYTATLRLAGLAFGINQNNIEYFFKAEDKEEALRRVLNYALDMLAYEKSLETQKSEEIESIHQESSNESDSSLEALFDETQGDATLSSLFKVQEAAQSLKHTEETEDIL